MFKNNIVNLKANFLLFLLSGMTLILINPVVANALGLGNARIISKLNEPLNIELEILAPNPKELQGILPNLASVQDFEDAGLDRPNFLNTLEFKVESQAGKPIIRLTTKEPVKEPVVNLLVELNSAQGRMLKDYIVLLDPPELTKNTQLSNSPSKPIQKQLVQRAENNDNENFDAFNQQSISVTNVAKPLIQQDAKQQELSQSLQTRLGKIEKQLNDLESEKAQSEQAKQALEEENGNLHDLVEAKQKEITQLKENQTIQHQPLAALPSGTPKTLQQRSELSHFSKAQILAPTEENLQNTMPSGSTPWLLLGLVLTIMLSAIIGLREFLKRRDITLPFEVNLPAFAFDTKTNVGTKKTENPPSAFNNNKQVNQEAFQNAVSLIQAAEQKQQMQVVTQSAPIESASSPIKTVDTATPVDMPSIEDAEIYITFSKFKMAEDILVKILNYDPDNIKARLKLIDLFFAQGKVDEAKEQFNFLPANFSTNYVQEYQAYQERLNPQQSESESESNSEMASDNVSTDQSEKEIVSEAESSPEFIQEFPQASENASTSVNAPSVELDPTIFQTKLDFAKVYIDMNDIESARDLLNEVLQSNFDNLKAEAQELLDKTKK